ncbi:DUF4124 domain-containing protein [Pseudomonas sp. SZMC_28357]|uniref:DUF4124 domain-containing protein n=1 Tax=Pseudomonas sp. SZMC_28357 TaxID=3074380 RepID=UPI00287222DD|nr:DUF4124 domain-containing protein [Pseudomonas sp. SZMC_28357]MDR9753148.1 DUF4124 domain-containing protein [Pseudomonas sp. SZMC_28357]
MRTMLFIASLSVSLSSACLAAPIYKWVDAQGVTHFDAQPPQDQPATTVITAPSPPAKAPPPRASKVIGDQQAIDQQVKKEVAQQQEQLKVFCQQARTNLAQLRNNPRLREETEGSMRRLTEEDRQARIVETEQQIADNCQ